jgi:hypothetical protein
MVDIQRKIK